MRPVSTIITVTSKGTPVPISTDKSVSVNAMFIQPHPDNAAGPYYVGTRDMNVAARTGIINILGGVTDFYAWPQAQNGMNQLSVADYAVDGSNDGDKFLVTWWIS